VDGPHLQQPGVALPARLMCVPGWHTEGRQPSIQPDTHPNSALLAAVYAPLQRDGRGAPMAHVDAESLMPPATLAGLARLESALPAGAFAADICVPNPVWDVTSTAHASFRPNASWHSGSGSLSMHARRKAVHAHADVELIAAQLSAARARANGICGFGECWPCPLEQLQQHSGWASNSGAVAACPTAVRSSGKGVTGDEDAGEHA
jgi:hypothetical protein